MSIRLSLPDLTRLFQAVVQTATAALNEPFVTVNTVTGDKGIKQAQDE